MKKINSFSQETYLNATLAFLAKVIETGRFMELIENRKETKDIGRFVTSEMSTILNKVALESVYTRAREIFKQEQRGSYAQVIKVLNSLIFFFEKKYFDKQKKIPFCFIDIRATEQIHLLC